MVCVCVCVWCGCVCVCVVCVCVCAEVLSLFDDLLLLGDKGQTVYLGPVDEAVRYTETNRQSHTQTHTHTRLATFLTLSLSLPFRYFESLGFHVPTYSNPSDYFLSL